MYTRVVLREERRWRTVSERAAADLLRRFDGFTWERFGTNSGLPSKFARAVEVTRAGELWVGSDAGAGVFDFKRRSYDPRGSQTGLANANVRQM